MKRFALILLSFALIAALGCGSAENLENTNKSETNNISSARKDIAVPLAKGFPTDFPLIKGMVTTSMKNSLTDPATGKQTGTGYYTQIKTEMTVAQAMNFYKSKFTESFKEERKNGAPVYSGYIKKYPVTIYFVKPGKKTMITIVLSGAKE